MRAWTGNCRDRAERGTGLEVGRYEVMRGCAAHKGSFAPVSPSGFIEPHRALHGIPATLLYAMYQNAVDRNYSGTTEAFAKLNVLIRDIFRLSFIYFLFFSCRR